MLDAHRSKVNEQNRPTYLVFLFPFARRQWIVQQSDTAHIKVADANQVNFHVRLEMCSTDKAVQYNAPFAILIFIHPVRIGNVLVAVY